ncbi:MAG: proline--tRNA ligase [Elusimicrobiota bacterium]
MKLSNFFLPTLKEVPGDAEVVSHRLMLRAGMIRKLSAGVYNWLPLGLRVLQKVEQIIREEMNLIDGQEVFLPALQPRELWEKTGRWAVYGAELMRLKDRHQREFCLGPTHEEIITDLVGKEVRSYRQLPLLFYQFQTKFRDEIRPRFGIMRAREFYMKDAYSFDAGEAGAEDSYRRAFSAYQNIFRRCGLKFVAVEADPGAIGGSFSHEFMVSADTGEEEIVSCVCGYGANSEKAETAVSASPLGKGGQGGFLKEELLPLEEVLTPNLISVEDVGNFLQQPAEKFIKTLIYLADQQPLMVLVRGDQSLNEVKLKNFLNCAQLFLAKQETVEKVTGASVGFAGPARFANPEKIKIYADHGLKTLVNGISGANQKDYHLKNINLSRDCRIEAFADLRKAKLGDVCSRCGKVLNFSRGIEVGHTFKLGTKYSKSLQATFLNETGEKKLFIMGCYGIGVSRVVAAAIEQSHDENGIIWPLTIAPFQISIVPIDYQKPNLREAADKIYQQLTGLGLEVLLDNRDERLGVKFKDLDLIGIPYRLIIGDRLLAQNKIEIKKRGQKEVEIINIDDVAQYFMFLVK